jgi:CopG family transcriptional regulator, nickel-responsive regulator
MSVIRFGVSLEQDILETLDSYIIDNNISNRSQAIRHLINNNMVEKKWQCNHIVAGSIIIVYDHHKNDIVKNLNDRQHDSHHLILSSQHFHLDNDKCMEIIAVKGKSVELTELADNLISLKGIIHGKLTMSRAD